MIRNRLLVCLAMTICSPVFADAQIDGENSLKVSVGMSGFAKQVVLPGSELTTKEVDPRRTPIALRIDNVFPHGDVYRYDLTFFGLEPGKHNLIDYLSRRDGTSTADLPPINVVVNSILPSGQFVPSAPPKGFVARIGGYYMALILVGLVWVAGLIAILFWGRGKTTKIQAAEDSGSVSEVDQIRTLLDRAMADGELSPEQKADLDMRVLNFWRTRRSITDVSVADAMSQLKNDEQAGPLLSGLERWLYSREAPSQSEIAQLLQPMSEIAAQASTENNARTGSVV